MTTTLQTLRFAELSARGVPLSHEEYTKKCRPIIVERVGDGIDIVDGYHRASGLCAWARAEGLDLGSVQVEIVDVSAMSVDVDTVIAASTPGPDQEDALDSIYEAAGL